MKTLSGWNTCRISPSSAFIRFGLAVPRPGASADRNAGRAAQRRSTPTWAKCFKSLGGLEVVGVLSEGGVWSEWRGGGGKDVSEEG